MNASICNAHLNTTQHALTFKKKMSTRAVQSACRRHKERCVSLRARLRSRSQNCGGEHAAPQIAIKARAPPRHIAKKSRSKLASCERVILKCCESCVNAAHACICMLTIVSSETIYLRVELPEHDFNFVYCVLTSEVA